MRYCQWQGAAGKCMHISIDPSWPTLGMHLQIRLKVKKTEEDIEAERRRADLLASLNSFYE